MVLSQTGKQSGEQMVFLYLPLLMSHLPDEARILTEDVKRAVLAVGGKKNAS